MKALMLNQKKKKKKLNLKFFSAQELYHNNFYNFLYSSLKLEFITVPLKPMDAEIFSFRD